MISSNFERSSKTEEMRLSKISLGHATVQDYKLSPIQTVIPREHFIKQQLSAFLASIENEKQITIIPYRGLEPEFFYDEESEEESEIEDDAEPPFLPHITDPRNHIYLAVHELAQFEGEGPVPDMENGHTYNTHQDKILRCLTLNKTNEGVIGAIYFKIHLKTQCCEIYIIETKSQYHHQHYGSILLHAAIFTGLMYNCHLIRVMSTSEAIGFYLKQGFFLNPSKYNLDSKDIYLNNTQEICQKYSRLPHLQMNVLDPNSLKLFERKIKQTCSEFRLLDTLLSFRHAILAAEFELRPALPEQAARTLTFQPTKDHQRFNNTKTDVLKESHKRKKSYFS